MLEGLENCPHSSWVSMVAQLQGMLFRNPFSTKYLSYGVEAVEDKTAQPELLSIWEAARMNISMP